MKERPSYELKGEDLIYKTEQMAKIRPTGKIEPGHGWDTPNLPRRKQWKDFTVMQKLFGQHYIGLIMLIISLLILTL